MNIIKRIYNWIKSELQLIYEDFNEGYVIKDQHKEDFAIIVAICFLIAAVVIFITTADTAKEIYTL